ncbi:hypothetical protein EPN27_02130 [Patescibacteria group bacterium]|nr:MAG: hypothetical protein EPN27_02130 [Patescibacteria group bacterium]
MNRKTLIIIFSLIILVSIGGYLYLSKKTPVATPINDTFPGGSGSFTGTGSMGGDDTLSGGDSFIPGSNEPLPRLYELHKVPVAGIGFTEEGKSSNNTIVARYIERGLGHIYETQLATLVESRIVNETRPRIVEALWGNGGKSVVVRFIDDKDGFSVVKTNIVNVGGITTSFARSTSTEIVSDFTTTEETSLPDYIPFMATVEDGGNKIFYLENGVNASTGTLATFNDFSVSTIFSSSFTEWLPQFPNQNLITLTTRPSAKVAGHLFFINPKNKSVTKILGGINGLTTLTSRDGKHVLFAETMGDAPELSVYDVANKNTNHFLLHTLPEKCVWGSKNSTMAYCAIPQNIPVATYPDQWYQGLVSFSDALWSIDAVTGEVSKIMTPGDYRAANLDMINLALSSDDSHLLFMNKTSGTPWMYRIAEISTPTTDISTTTVSGM